MDVTLVVDSWARSTAEENIVADVNLENWYYQIELEPNVMSGGRVRGTSSMTRKIVSHLNLSDTRCLDIGAQEGLLSVLMARQGASQVVAYDRLDLRSRLSLVQKAYDVKIDYFHSIEMHELKAATASRGLPPFDVVVFAGVLYHMIDPLAGMAIARSFLREGGIAVIESSVFVSEDFVMHFNAGGRFYKGSNYFQVSLACYDYFARMLRLKPIDMLFTPTSDDGISRVSLVCRAVDHVVAEPEDLWMGKPFVQSDMGAVGLEYKELTSAAPPVPYTPINPTRQFRGDTDCLDVLGTFHASAPNRGTRREGQLHLSDHI